MAVSDGNAAELAEWAARLQAELNLVLIDLSAMSTGRAAAIQEAARVQAELESAIVRHGEEQSRLRSEFDAAIAGHAEERARLQTELGTAIATHAADRARLQAELDSTMAAQREEVARLLADQQRLHAELDATVQDRTFFKNELDLTHRTLSWRVTAPLRRLRRLGRRLR